MVISPRAGENEPDTAGDRGPWGTLYACKIATRVPGSRSKGPSSEPVLQSLGAAIQFVVGFVVASKRAVGSNRASLVAALWLTVMPGRAMAAPFDPEGQDWEGLSQLVQTARSELGTQRVALSPTLPLGELAREDGILLIHPERSLDVDELSAFMRAGGRVLLLDDYGTGDDLLRRFGIRRTALPARPAQMLRGKPSLAIAEAASAHPLVHDVVHLVTNHATGLEHPALSPLLVVRGDGEPDVLLGVAGAVGHGRLIAIGDASIVINEMMRYPGNLALSRALVHYATDDDVWGKRSGKLYVLTNGFQTTGRFGDTSRAGTAVGEVRRALVESLETLRHEGLPPPAAYLAALALALGIVVWTSARVGRTHKAVSPRFVSRVPAALQGGVAGHAALLGLPRTSRVLAMLELKSALEEQLATRLGLDRAPPPDELVAKVRAAGLLDESRARSLSRLLGELGRIEAFFARLARPQGRIERIRDAQVLVVSARVRELLDAVGRSPRDTVERAP
jgi:hypothetical protein